MLQISLKGENFCEKHDVFALEMGRAVAKVHKFVQEQFHALCLVFQ